MTAHLVHIGKTLELSELCETEHFEGGYSNASGDYGGATNMGITQGSWDAYLKTVPWATRQTLPKTVDQLTIPLATAFYSRWWENPCLGLSGIDHAGAQFMIFDASVLSGPGTAAEWAQEVAGVRMDGDIGPVTTAAINAIDAVAFIQEYYAVTEHYYHGIVLHDHTQSQWLNGWLNRAAARQAYALSLTNQGD